MPALDDYLTKQLLIEKNVVTYRSLSRQFGLHVNLAKSELSNFYRTSIDSPTRVFATYLLSGELFPVPPPNRNGPSSQHEDGMDVDPEFPNDHQSADDDEDQVLTTTLTLVGEADLELARSKYARIFSTHVYCLSPSPLTDAGLICDPSAVVYKADTNDAPTSSIALGRVVGPDVRIGKAPPPVASSSKAAEPIPRKPTLKVKTEKSDKTEESPPVKAASTSISSAEKEKSGSAKPKASGKLDWSKAKKTLDNDKSKEKEAKPKVKKEESASPIEKAAKKTANLALNDDSPKDESKRGVKRKAAGAADPAQAASDAEQKPRSKETTEREKAKAKSTTPVSAPSSTRETLKLRKNRIVSDSEDEASDVPSRPAPRDVKSKSKVRARAAALAEDALESEGEKSLRAMMDIDDALVEKASASRPPPTQVQHAEDSDGDVEMAQEPDRDPEPELEEEDTPKPKPRKKKAKKVVPVGRNGLKKRRVMKSRMTVDAKGYMGACRVCLVVSRRVVSSVTNVDGLDVFTEDYSSYESVDEEDAVEAEAPKKGRGKKAAGGATAASSASAPTKGQKEKDKAASADPEASEADAPPASVKSKSVARTSSSSAGKSAKKPAGGRAGAQGSLKDFFGKPKK
ncbi:DNA polymerase subunit Cdc27-domain-containing protein [Trametes maxima]|nr:DNA polymerase subunit Cdc27-domain-containing protein [Trametes maxima]